MASSIKSMVQRSVRPIHHRFRSGKSELFLKLLGAEKFQRLLDVGGGTGMNGEFAPLYGKFESVTIANLNPSDEDMARSPNLRIIKANGCLLPFADKTFDWVFSNAVIEHVGGWKDQQNFASEIRRVASKGYFITTPNRYFPIEPHALLPFYQFYPEWMKSRALHFSAGYMNEVEFINLLTKSEMQCLFPEAHVRRVNLASSIIAFQSYPGYASAPASYS